MITFSNNGQDIVSTDYFDSEHAKKGACYLTWNARAGRLLLPDSLRSALVDMGDARYVVVSQGPAPEYGGVQMVELMFEDETDSPFCLHIITGMTDRLISGRDEGRGMIVSVWTRGDSPGSVECQLRLPAKCRAVPRIPCLEPW